VGEIEQMFKVFPNPTNGMITIELGGVNASFTELTLFSVSGTKVYSEILTSSESVILDMKQYPEGLYFFYLLKNNGEASSKLISYFK
jgi:hypothetical protein